MPSTKRVEAGKRNRRLRGDLTPEGRERLRAAALVNKPWAKATGPRTPAGKAAAAANGKRRQVGDRSARETRADMAGVQTLIAGMRAAAAAAAAT
jgi:hypothetical protein